MPHATVTTNSKTLRNVLQTSKDAETDFSRRCTVGKTAVNASLRRGEQLQDVLAGSEISKKYWGRKPGAKALTARKDAVQCPRDQRDKV
jgi:hypothetical protein